jgi:Cu+-exporting ATPase
MNYATKLLSISLFVLAAACGGAAATGHPGAGSATEADKANLKAPGEAKLGDKTTCPVSKEAFTVTDKSPKVEHNGKTYYFCCGGCDTKFKAEPAKYLTPGA